jgi:hypothetical protein
VGPLVLVDARRERHHCADRGDHIPIEGFVSLANELWFSVLYCALYMALFGGFFSAVFLLVTYAVRLIRKSQTGALR